MKADHSLRTHGPWGDRVFLGITRGAAALLVLLGIGIVVSLLAGAWEALERFGPSFLWTADWDPVAGRFGALGTVVGTLMATLIAMVIAIPLGLLVAFFLVELVPKTVARPIGYAIELLAAIPSIIYGMWGLFVFAPFMADHVQPALADTLGFLPLFQGPPMGIGMLTAGIILAFMVLPFLAAVMRDVLSLVPAVVKESAYGMGATRFEVARQVTVRYGFSGILGAVFLGLGRAVGETMAVTFVIGNSHEISASLFAPSNTIASTLANEFTEATESLYLSSLIGLGLVLFCMTLIIQVLAQWWIRRVALRAGGGM